MLTHAPPPTTTSSIIYPISLVRHQKYPPRCEFYGQKRMECISKTQLDGSQKEHWYSFAARRKDDGGLQHRKIGVF